MKYKNLLNWIEADDACEVSSSVIESAHDPAYAGEQDFIVGRIKSLIETGVTIQSITLNVWGKEDEGTNKMEFNNDTIDFNSFLDVINDLYNNGMSIEHMTIKVDINKDQE
jgi:hypothetical protein